MSGDISAEYMAIRIFIYSTRDAKKKSKAQNVGKIFRKYTWSINEPNHSSESFLAL